MKMYMKNKLAVSLIVGVSIAFIGCSSYASKQPVVGESNTKNGALEQTADDKKENQIVDNENKLTNSQKKTKEINLDDVKNKYKGESPTQWGEKIDGVISKIDTNDKVIALTFDACGGKGGDGYDEKLINFLIKENVQATLFINARWIDANPDTFKMLSQNPLFEIENHGSEHRPLSVNGRSIYNIKGTNSVDEVINEVYVNEKKIQQLTGRKPRYFRSGTAYYDNVAVSIERDLGEKPVNFGIIGDAGATYSSKQIKEASLGAKQGSIIIYHINHPEKSTAQGIMEVVPLLKEKGFNFVKLEDYDRDLK